jgi:hypothetical protein
MAATEQLERDLAYVKEVVDRRVVDEQRTPFGVSLTWSAFALIGFTWLDLNPNYASWFLILASPVAFGISWWLASRSAWRLGEFDQISARRQFLHWGSFFVPFAAVLSLGFAGRLGGDPLGQVILIIVGQAYILAGIHFSARLIGWLGLLMIIGAVALTYIDRWGWTSLGVLFSIGIITTSFIGGRRHG